MRTKTGFRPGPFTRISQSTPAAWFWISGMGLAGVIHLTLLVLCGANSGDLVVATIGWGLVVLLFAGEAPRVTGGGRCATAAGLILLGLAQTCRMAAFDLWFLKILSLMLMGGVLLFGCGWGGLVAQWRLPALLLLVSAPEKCLEFLNHGGTLILVHARIAGFLLHLLGMDLVIHGNQLLLSGGSVEVQEACSGLVLMLLLLKIALLVSIAFPIRWSLRFMMCAAALLTGLAVGVIRVAVLAAILHNKDWFAQMHGPAGMSLFPMLGFLLYAPFLFPVEKPLLELLQKIRSTWRSTPREAVWEWRIILTVVIGVAVGICLLKGIWINSPSSILSPDALVGLRLPGWTAELRTVPADLLTAKFNAVQGARQWEFGDGIDQVTTLVCSISGALVGPEEMIRDPKIAHFLDGQLGRRIFVPSDPAGYIGWKIQDNKNGGTQAVAAVPGGTISVKAVDADGDLFFSSSEYAAAQRATLFRLSTWKNFLLTGRPLKDLRYWLVVVVSGKQDG